MKKAITVIICSAIIRGAAGTVHGVADRYGAPVVAVVKAVVEVAADCGEPCSYRRCYCEDVDCNWYCVQHGHDCK